MGLSVAALRKRFGAVTAVDGVSFHVAAGELVCLLGPSGCGKTTTLRCVAGLEDSDEGTVTLDGVPLTDTERGDAVPPHRRNIGMVFQSYAVWPHMTVWENVRYPLRFRKGLSEAVRTARTSEALRQVRLDGLRDRMPHQLSGGQQQRVALARALVMEPRLLLFDEPLSNLDARLREELRLELVDLQARLHVPAVYVTHDQAEALALATRIAVMHEGRILQMGSPAEIYHQPANEHVARFIGSVNLIPGRIEEASRPPRVGVRTDLGRMWLVPNRPLAVGGDVLIAVRPEGLMLHNTRPEGSQSFEAVLVHTMFAGSTTDCVVVTGQLRLRAQVRDATTLRRGDRVFVSVDESACALVPPAQASSRPALDQRTPGNPPPQPSTLT